MILCTTNTIIIIRTHVVDHHVHMSPHIASRGVQMAHLPSQAPTKESIGENPTSSEGLCSPSMASATQGSDENSNVVAESRCCYEVSCRWS